MIASMGLSVFIVGILLGREWALDDFERRTFEFKKEVEFWREIATRKTVPEPPAIDGSER